jgi:hypothetical protein
VANVRIHGTTEERPADRLSRDQVAMQPYVSPSTTPSVQLAGHWPRYPLQQSPKEYDRILQEVPA